MADNITLNTGTGGASLATDDVGGVQYQRTKVTFGADGSATDVSPGAGIPTAGQYFDTTGTGAALNADIVAGMDVRPYRMWTLQLTGTFSATVRVQGSNDNVNWLDQTGYQTSNTSAFPSVSFSSVNMWTGPVYTKYLRVRVTSYTSGSVGGALLLSSEATPPPTAYVTGFGSGISVAAGPTTPADALSNASTSALNVFPVGYTGASWDRLRTPNVFKTVQASSLGNNTLWTPTSGKKFRLMKYRIMIPNGAIGSANSYLVMQFKDGSTNMPIIETCFLTTTASNVAGNTWTSGLVDLGNGFLSSAANSALVLNLNYALTDGDLRVLVMGTEE
jgi:hypothetical protein